MSPPPRPAGSSQASRGPIWRRATAFAIGGGFLALVALVLVHGVLVFCPAPPASVPLGLNRLWGSQEQSDLPLQFAVWWEEVRRLFRAGEPPWISDHIGGGVPLLANGQTGLPFPLQLPVWLWGPERGTTIMGFVKLFFAFWGICLWLRRWGVVGAAVPLAAVAWAFSLVMVSWLPVPLTWVLAATPWAFWLLLGTLRGDRKAAGALALLLGCILGWSTHPETAAFLALALVAVGFFLAWPHPRRWRRLMVPFGLAFLVGLGFGLPVILTVGDSSKYHAVASLAPGLSFRDKLELASLLLVPFRHGNPGFGQFAFPFPHAPVALACGSVVWMLILAGQTRPRHRRFCWALLSLALGSLTLFFQLPLAREIGLALPVLNKMTWPRVGFLIPLSLIVLAALRFPRVRPPLGKLLWAWSLLQGVILILSFTADPKTGVWVWPTAFVPTLAALALWRKPSWLPVLALWEVGWWSVGVVPASSPGSTDPLLVRLAATAKPGERVLATQEVVPANLLARMGLADLRSHDPVRPRALAALHKALGARGEDLPGPITTPWAGLSGAWGVKWLLTGPEGLPSCCRQGWEEVEKTPRLRLFRNLRWQPSLRAVQELVVLRDTHGRTSDELDFSRQAMVFADSALPLPRGSQVQWEVLEERPWRLRLRAKPLGQAILVWHVPYTIGWQTFLDGKPQKTFMVNLAAMAVTVPPGEHEVVWQYRPPGLHLGLALGGLGLVGVLVLVYRRRS